MCGVTSPTKPIVPPTETQTPISTETAMSTVSFARRTFTPMFRALSSPMAKAFSSRACRHKIVPQTASAAASSAAFP